MAISAAYGFTNTTASTSTVTPVAVGMSNYAVVRDDPGECVIKNITCPIDQDETMIFQCKDLNQINQEEKNIHPPKVNGGRQLTARIENKKRCTSSVDDTFMEDLPISLSLSWRFPKNANISQTDLILMVQRLLGAMQDSSTDGWIIDQLMMQQLNPKA